MSSSIYRRSKKFIYNSKKVHGNKYDYSKINYINIRTNVTITCPVHGDFEQLPDNHLNRKRGCPSCGGSKRKTTQEFIDDAKKVHGNSYEYTLVNYNGNREKIQIVCHEHGVFNQTPKDHLAGCGCPKCGGSATLTQLEFVIRSMRIHQNKYDYSCAKYVTDRTKVTIKCPEHGNFTQIARSHMRGAGCPKCRQAGGYSRWIFGEDEKLKHYPGRLYLVQFTNINDGTVFLKVGITKRTVKSRFSSGYSKYNYEVLIDKELELYEAFLLEQHILCAFVDTKFKPKSPFDGRTECFTLQYKDQIMKTILTA